MDENKKIEPVDDFFYDHLKVTVERIKAIRALYPEFTMDEVIAIEKRIPHITVKTNSYGLITLHKTEFPPFNHQLLSQLQRPLRIQPGEPFIISAAIWFHDHKFHTATTESSGKLGLIIPGYNYESIHILMKEFPFSFKEKYRNPPDGSMPYHGYVDYPDDKFYEEGFITSTNNFVDKHEAYQIAAAALQISNSVVLSEDYQPKLMLEPEDLYK